MILTATDQLWRADITYIRLRDEFVFLAVILDAYPYPEGTYDLLERIGKLEQQADKDKSVDLSKIRV